MEVIVSHLSFQNRNGIAAHCHPKVGIRIPSWPGRGWYPLVMTATVCDIEAMAQSKVREFFLLHNMVDLSWSFHSKMGHFSRGYLTLILKWLTCWNLIQVELVELGRLNWKLAPPLWSWIYFKLSRVLICIYPHLYISLWIGIAGFELESLEIEIGRIEAKAKLSRGAFFHEKTGIATWGFSILQGNGKRCSPCRR